MGSETQVFLDWVEKHQDSCNSNFSGSSPAMEAEGGSILWARAVEKNKLRYTVVISDGDAKTNSQLNSKNPYGSDDVLEVDFLTGFFQSRLTLFLFIYIWSTNYIFLTGFFYSKAY